MKEFNVLVEQLFFYSKKGENWIIIETKYSKKNKMKCKHNLHIWEILNYLWKLNHNEITLYITMGLYILKWVKNITL